MEYVADKFLKEIEEIQDKYKNDKDAEKLANRLSHCASKYKKYFGTGDYLINLAEEVYYPKGDYSAGLSIIKVVHKHFKYIADEVTVYLRMAEYYIESGDIEKGVEYLIKLCTETVDNYEESIEFRGLTSVWEKYNHFVKGMVPPSKVFNSGNPIPPEKCTMQICDILNLSDDNLLSELSTHLNEMSANGEVLSCLNKWEKLVFYINELCEEVNSGGFSNYLYYYGNHFEKAKISLETIGAEKSIDLLNKVENKFPRKKVPKNTDSIQNNIDKMEEKGINFEKEDAEYYDFTEKELLKKLTTYILENKKHFR